MNRRGFLKSIGGAAAGLAAAPLLGGAAALEAALEPAGGAWEKRRLGRTGLSVSPVGIGAMTTRDADVIRYAVDRGVDYVDTADCYMGGENERIVGRALKGVRDKVVLASKVHVGPAGQMIRSVERSLKSLDTDVIDVMQLHGISSEAEVVNDDAREALRRLVEQGKVRVPGVTTHSGQEAVLRAVMTHGFYKTVLVAYSFRADVGLKAAIKQALGSGQGLSATIRDAGAAGIGVIAMKTQAGGYAVPGSSASPHQAALAWVLENPGVATTIPGMVSFAQVDENLGARGMRLGWSGRKTLSLYSRAIADRHCGLCGGCAGACPNGVDVQGVLRCLTYREGYGRDDLARRSYGELGSGRAMACVSCDGCVVSCRLGLAVGRLARRAHGALA
ncbi:MAG: aldo/keto reductase [Gemmatimonadota bacterium]